MLSSGVEIVCPRAFFLGRKCLNQTRLQESVLLEDFSVHVFSWLFCVWLCDMCVMWSVEAYAVVETVDLNLNVNGPKLTTVGQVCSLWL